MNLSQVLLEILLYLFIVENFPPGIPDNEDVLFQGETQGDSRSSDVPDKEDVINLFQGESQDEPTAGIIENSVIPVYWELPFRHFSFLKDSWSALLGECIP